ncbi:hypothetical protein HELRODRAFT_99711 [Helobdella robusta]|uniref:K Homology domain-containing protein n=1 Tax=Helobdella robusta TaxID=6412 RepID=T1G9U6_HELRO|nr:hypothetical protein HELRODRAFT_99711 [Helobdella robusta]ESO04478.1 hypothetical protein HELRODRAFT_99711 [Helobdella robusta]
MARDNSRSTDGDYSDNDFDDDQDISMRFFATDKEVGCIIGKKGDNIKALRNESGAKIQISDGSLSERIVTIRGTASQVIRAINLIGIKLEEDNNHSNYLEEDDSLSFRLIVPNSNCGSLIGRNGANIKELRERTGSKIQVANDLLPDSTEREVGLSGSMSGVMDCVKKLAKIAIETKPRSPHVPYNPSYSGGGGSGYDGYSGGVGAGRKGAGSGRGRFDGGKQNSHDDDFKKAFKQPQQQQQQQDFLSRPKNSGLTTEELIIPNDLVGIIIGKSGNKINEIRQNSGAQIKIIECEDGSDNRRFVITGPRGNVQSAIYLIQNAKNRRRALANKQQHHD